jgi:ADP-ribose pyrophosphatase
VSDNSPIEILEERDLLTTWHFVVRRLRLRWSGQEITRDIEVHRGSAAVVAFDEHDRVALVRQFRIPVGRWTLELPTGGCEEGEQPAETAARELTEEVGLVADGLEPLVRFANAPGHSTQWTHVFVAASCTTVDRTPVGVEEQDSKVVRLPLAEAVELVERGEILDAKSMLGLLTAWRRFV